MTISKNKTLISVLLAGTIFSSPITASALIPTSEYIKQQEQAFSSLSTPYSLTEIKYEDKNITYSQTIEMMMLKNIPEYQELLDAIFPSNSIIVFINGNAYYFIPSETDKEVLTTVSNIAGNFLTEDINGIFDFDGTKYTFVLPQFSSSVFSYTEGTQTDNDFSLKLLDNDGKITTSYYKINFSPINLMDFSRIQWSEVSSENKGQDNVYEIKLSEINGSCTVHGSFLMPGA